jgi:hypothetical protein
LPKPSEEGSGFAFNCSLGINEISCFMLTPHSYL